MIEVEKSGDNNTPLHLNLFIFLENHKWECISMSIDWCDLKSVLMPRQRLLKQLDHHDSKTLAKSAGQ
jgi:hypothetical protein